MPRVSSEWCDEIIVVDGGSTDGSQEWARENKYKLFVQKRPGLRFAYTEVWPSITTDYVITFSPDNNSIPEMIPRLIQELQAGDRDMTIASRYLPPATSEDDDWVTALGNWTFTRLINVLHRGKYTDAMVMFRGYKVGVVYDLDLLNESRYRYAELLCGSPISWEPLLSIRAAKMELNVSEIAASEPPRVGGKRKLLVIQWGFAYLLQTIVEFFRR